MTFENLPRAEKEFLLEKMGLPDKEFKVLWLRYVDDFSYRRIAAEIRVSPKSVGNLLTRARIHVVDIAKTCYPIADDRTKHLIDTVGWRELEWPTLKNRRGA